MGAAGTSDVVEVPQAVADDGAGGTRNLVTWASISLLRKSLPLPGFTGGPACLLASSRP